MNVRWFVIGIMICATFLQRFGVPFGGGQQLSIAGPIGLALAGYGLVQGSIAIHRPRLLIYAGILVTSCLGAISLAFGHPPFNAQVSFPSYFQFLGITAFPIFVFAQRMDEDAFFRLVNTFIIAIAICGIVQFAAQFVGVQVFSFKDYVPDSLLFESGYNLKIDFGIGSLLKSNGFFLVEPSVMSQFMAMGIIIEVLYFRRLVWLGVLGLALVLAESGTGILVLAAFVVAVALRLGLRGVLLAGLMLVFAGVLAGVVSLLVPEVADIAQGRLGEFNTQGTSGHDRFIAPFWVLGDVIREYPQVNLFGMGAGTSQNLTVPYEYSMNTPIKIWLEYGIPALVLYVSLFVFADRTPRQSVLMVPALVLLLFTGGYQQFGSIVYFIAMLICTARLQPSLNLGALRAGMELAVAK